MLSKISNLLYRFKTQFALGVLVTLVIFIAFTSVPKIDGQLTGFDLENSVYYKAGKRIGTLFNIDDFIEVKVAVNNTSTQIVFNSLSELEEELTTTFEGLRVNSLHQARRLFKNDIADSSSILNTIQKSANIPVIDKLISKDRQSFLMVILLDSTHNFNLEKFNTLLEQPKPGIKRFVSVSHFHIENEVEKTLSIDIIVLSGLILVLFTVLIFYIYKDLKALFYVLIIVVISILPAIFFITILDIPINLISALIIPVVLILSLADAIHLLTGYYQSTLTGSELKIKDSISTYIIPSFFTSLTTTIAFLSFLFNASESIKNFGLIISFSISCSFIFTYAISPFLLQKITPKPLQKKQLINRLLIVLNRYRKPISYLLLVTALIASPLFIKLSFKTDFNAFIPKYSKTLKDRNELIKDFDSQLTLSILLEKTNKKTSNKETEKSIHYIIDELETIQSISNIKSIKDQTEFKKQFGALSHFVKFPNKNNPYRNANRSAYMIELRYKDMKRLEQSTLEIENILSLYSTDFTPTLFSKALLVNEINKNISQSLFKSLGFSFGLIFLSILVLTRNLKVTIISLFVNLVPLSFISLIFFIGNLDLDILTAITSVICFGVIVDDTIHIVYQKTVLKQNKQELGFGILSTSIVLIIGFLAFTISRFVPSQIFGMVSALIFFFTVIADLTLLPFLLDKFIGKKTND